MHHLQQTEFILHSLQHTEWHTAHNLLQTEQHTTHTLQYLDRIEHILQHTSHTFNGRVAQSTSPRPTAHHRTYSIQSATVGSGRDRARSLTSVDTIKCTCTWW